MCVWHNKQGETDMDNITWQQYPSHLENVSICGNYVFGTTEHGVMNWKVATPGPWNCNGGGGQAPFFGAWAACTRKSNDHCWTTGTKPGGHPWYKLGLGGT